jgi:hypothetical protein
VNTKVNEAFYAFCNAITEKAMAGEQHFVDMLDDFLADKPARPDFRFHDVLQKVAEEHALSRDQWRMVNTLLTGNGRLAVLRRRAMAGMLLDEATA